MSRTSPVADLQVTGTLTAAQATAGTPVAGGTVALLLTAGQSTWSVGLSGTWSSGTSVLFETTTDGINWITSEMDQDGSAASPVTSVAGAQANPLSYTGACAGKAGVRVRCTPFHAGDSITVTIRASTGVGGGGAAGAAAAAVTIADGADVTQGAKADPLATDNTGSWSIVALLKAIWGRLRGGQQTSANSLPVVIASDQVAIPATQSGTWTVQPGNTANTTPWLVAENAYGVAVVASANFTRPADTTAYASGDLVANSTTAGSVVAMSFTVARVAAGSGSIRRLRLRKSGTSITSAQFRLHLYTAAPTAANGDNGAWSTDGAANYLGSLDVTMDKVFTDGAGGNGTPSVGNEINFSLASGTTIVGLLEARSGYTPISTEVFTATLEVLQN